MKCDTYVNSSESIYVDDNYNQFKEDLIHNYINDFRITISSHHPNTIRTLQITSPCISENKHNTFQCCNLNNDEILTFKAYELKSLTCSGYNYDVISPPKPSFTEWIVIKKSGTIKHNITRNTNYIKYTNDEYNTYHRLLALPCQNNITNIDTTIDTNINTNTNTSLLSSPSKVSGGNIIVNIWKQVLGDLITM
jgi:hypothetical protein